LYKKYPQSEGITGPLTFSPHSRGVGNLK